RHDGTTGTLYGQSTAQEFLLDALSIAHFSNPVGHVVVTGGVLSLTNEAVWVGREGTGAMTVSNETVQARSVCVGMSPDGTNRPFGTLTLAGGITALSSNLIVGTSSFSTGQVFMAGGSL